MERTWHSFRPETFRNRRRRCVPYSYPVRVRSRWNARRYLRAPEGSDGHSRGQPHSGRPTKPCCSRRERPRGDEDMVNTNRDSSNCRRDDGPRQRPGSRRSELAQHLRRWRGTPAGEATLYLPNLGRGRRSARVRLHGGGLTRRHVARRHHPLVVRCRACRGTLRRR